MATLTCGYKTDVGRVRKTNEDSLAVLDSVGLEGLADGLFVVADGMGGYAGGETASRLTVETVPAVVREVLAESDGRDAPDTLAEALRESIAAANEEVWKRARAHPETRRMGTTCVAALVARGQAAIGNVGDSRIYLLRGGELTQLTNDHSLVQEHVRQGELTAEEARRSRFRNVITRAIGIANAVQPDVDRIELQEGDTLLLCTDGLTNMVREPEIARLLAQTADAQETSERLVEAALRGGGEDNVTAVVVRHGAFTPLPSSLPPEDEETTDEEGEEDGFFRPVSVSGRRGGDAGTRGRGEMGKRRPNDPTTPSPNYPTPSKRGWRLFAAALLCLAAGLALGYLGHERYTLVSSWPFLTPRRPPAAPSVPPPAPAPDLASLDYGDPELVLQRPVRAAPIACDAQGNIHLMTRSGKTFAVTPNGWQIGDFSQEPILLPDAAADQHSAFDAQGNLYVTRRAERAIFKYDRNGTQRWHLEGSARLKAPEGIAVDGAGNIYVVDANRLKRLRARSPSSGDAGSGRQRPNDPTTQSPNSLTVEDSHAAR
jgi:serine/threonine protein phosphatase PrpC